MKWPFTRSVVIKIFRHKQMKCSKKLKCVKMIMAVACCFK